MFLKNTKILDKNGCIIGKVIQWLPNMAAVQNRLSPNAIPQLITFVQIELADGSIALWNTAEINTHVSEHEKTDAGFHNATDFIE